jgi:chemotaxis protein MotA
MFAIIGIVVVIGTVIGGYLMEHGHLEVLVQPAELVIIGGAALGTLLVANPLSTVKSVISGLIAVIKGSPYNKASYIETLKMMNELFMQACKQGMARLEEDIENPGKSLIHRPCECGSPHDGGQRIAARTSRAGARIC